MIRGLIFDCDGLLLDSEMPAYQSWQEAYAEHGCDLPLARWAACLGGSGAEFDACAYLEQLLGRLVDREVVRARRLQRKLELVASQPLLPGVLDYITQGKQLGLKLGVASSSPREWVEGHLSRLGIAQYFDAVVCADDVDRVKPYPDLYQTVLAKLDLGPQEAIVFEDSPNGIASAKAAGIFCVAVPNTLTCQLPLGNPDTRLASMADLPLRKLIARVEAKVGAA